ncbi:uncharacterized protein [Miscanthus floridulus]|uniref:uncharacterized protein n=1 Tax=Miscanthus floridulus TaxID=154761 RepID=UPI0034573E72
MGLVFGVVTTLVVDMAFLIQANTYDELPDRWVQMEKLENHALFISLDRRNPAISCVNPERWGGKSNCVYVARLFDDANPEETWTALEVGQSVPHHCVFDIMMYGHTFPPEYRKISSLCLFPSLVYGASQ